MAVLKFQLLFHFKKNFQKRNMKGVAELRPHEETENIIDTIEPDDEPEGESEGPARQDEATAVMIDKALKKFGKRIIVETDAREFLREVSKDFLGGLLGRPLLAGSMDRNKVKRAINDWIPTEGVGNEMRFLFATQPSDDFVCCSVSKLKRESLICMWKHCAAGRRPSLSLH